MLSALFSHRRDVPAPTRGRAPRPAAGLLLRYVDFEGTWVLLGKRHRNLGGTWANIGGSLDPGEHPLAGALREFHEELAVPAHRLTGARIAAVVDCGTPDRPYTLYVLDVVAPFDDARLSWENTDLFWVHSDDVCTYDLHPGFARAWAKLNHPAKGTR
jgi:8-oxo-dGTP pyrophosphatase MutT (NUDIX family)